MRCSVSTRSASSRRASSARRSSSMSSSVPTHSRTSPRASRIGTPRDAVPPVASRPRCAGGTRTAQRPRVRERRRATRARSRPGRPGAAPRATRRRAPRPRVCPVSARHPGMSAIRPRGSVRHTTLRARLDQRAVARLAALRRGQRSLQLAVRLRQLLAERLRLLELLLELRRLLLQLRRPARCRLVVRGGERRLGALALRDVAERDDGAASVHAAVAQRRHRRVDEAAACRRASTSVMSARSSVPLAAEHAAHARRASSASRSVAAAFGVRRPRRRTRPPRARGRRPRRPATRSDARPPDSGT